MDWPRIARASGRAILLEKLIVRDGRSLDDATAIVRDAHPSLDAPRVRTLAERLPERIPRPRLIQLPDGELRFAAPDASDARAHESDARRTSARTARVVRETIAALPLDPGGVDVFALERGAQLAEKRLDAAVQRPLRRAGGPGGVGDAQLSPTLRYWWLPVRGDTKVFRAPSELLVEGGDRVVSVGRGEGGNRRIRKAGERIRPELEDAVPRAVIGDLHAGEGEEVADHRGKAVAGDAVQALQDVRHLEDDELRKDDGDLAVFRFLQERRGGFALRLVPAGQQ